jgi:hypothetical protein
MRWILNNNVVDGLLNIVNRLYFLSIRMNKSPIILVWTLSLLKNVNVLQDCTVRTKKYQQSYKH